MPIAKTLVAGLVALAVSAAPPESQAPESQAGTVRVEQIGLAFGERPRR